jgi:iron complex transport system substrate-binding protein
MKKQLVLLLYTLIFGAIFHTKSIAQANKPTAIEVTDDEGTVITLDQPAERLISLAPSLTEIIYAAGAGNRLVGVVEFSDYPTAATQLPIVGRHDLLDLETILSLAPDLIIAWQTGNPRASINRLRELGITVYVAEPKDLGTIADHLDNVGVLTGATPVAAAASEEFRQALRALNETYSWREPVATFYQVWDQPLISAGGEELINDIITLCGGRNVFADISRVAPKVSVEAVLAKNPDVIIASGMDGERPQWLDRWRSWPSLTAVTNDSLYFIPPDLLQRHTPRALLGARQLCEFIDSARTAP